MKWAGKGPKESRLINVVINHGARDDSKVFNSTFTEICNSSGLVKQSKCKVSWANLKIMKEL